MLVDQGNEEEGEGGKKEDEERGKAVDRGEDVGEWRQQSGGQRQGRREGLWELW